MSELTTPAQIARETLRRLAEGRHAPTPENYRELYNEIAGVMGDTTPASASEPALRKLISDLLCAGPLAQLAERAGLDQEARLLAGRARAARGATGLEQLARDVAGFGARLGAHLAGSHEVQDGLLQLLRLLVDNVQCLIVDDTWVLRQLDVVRELVARPLDLQTVRAAEAYLREVLLRQEDIKKGLAEAKAALRQTVESILGHLGGMADDTGEYGRLIEAHAERIHGADDIRMLGTVIADLLKDTRAMQTRTAERQREWQEASARAQAAEARISELEDELLRISDQLRVDHLTGALNRRGFEETFARMAAEARRSGGPLCLGLLDVDNFKQLNDRFGHGAGDDALVHLARVVRGAVRPSDAISRHGGEEFVVLLPDTDLAGAEALMVRLQRELTRQYFLHDNERVLITFSAGVSQWLPGEALDAALKRADDAQYQAKSTGKNRVVAAPLAAGPGALPLEATQK